MAVSLAKMKLKQSHLEDWSVREQLALACSVMRSGDQNWVSVSRAIKPYGERNRPPEWFSQKNCALQYSDLLEKVETPKRKRGERGELETPGNQIVRKLTIERIEELKTMVVEEQQQYKKVKQEIESIKCGQRDDSLPEILAVAIAAKQDSIPPELSEVKLEQDDVLVQGDIPFQHKLHTSFSETEDSTQDSFTEPPSVDITSVTDDELNQSQNASMTFDIQEEKPKIAAPSSQLLSTLLQSKLKNAGGPQTMKTDLELESEVVSQQVTPVKVTPDAPPIIRLSIPSLKLPPESMSTSPSTAAPTLSKLLGSPAPGKNSIKTAITQLSSSVSKLQSPPATSTVSMATTESKTSPTLAVEPEKSMQDIDILIKEEPVEEVEISSVVEIDVIASWIPEFPSKDEETDKQDTSVKDEQVDVEAITDDPCTSFISIDEEVSIKEDPPSPSSSVSSKISESGTPYMMRGVGRRRGRGRGIMRGSGRRRGRGRPRRIRRSVVRVTRKSLLEGEGNVVSRLSDPDSSDEETARESDDTASTTAAAAMISAPPSFLSESFPNSPASLSHCSDTEDEKAYRTWKKSIMLVWRSAANHKYANVFLHPVREEIAPGYRAVVHRPMDLSTIKKYIELGMIRTTTEFQRDLMLMFTNAIMYNSSDHNVFKMATEMYDDVMANVEQYISTQIMVQSETKVLRPTRRAESSDKEEDAKRRRASSEQQQEGGKAKKRKSRLEET